MRTKLGQVWVETVLYTLIGLALIGITLAIVTPKINESRDRALVEQSIGLLNAFDEKILEVVDRGNGNVRKVSGFSLKRGEFVINSSGDNIVLILDNLQEPYSEPGVEIQIGRVSVLSEEGSRRSSVKLKLDYGNIANITFRESEEIGTFSASSTPYEFTVENEGNIAGRSVVDIDEIS